MGIEGEGNSCTDPRALGHADDKCVAEENKVRGRLLSKNEHQPRWFTIGHGNIGSQNRDVIAWLI